MTERRSGAGKVYQGERRRGSEGPASGRGGNEKAHGGRSAGRNTEEQEFRGRLSGKLTDQKEGYSYKSSGKNAEEKDKRSFRNSGRNVEEKDKRSFRNSGRNVEVKENGGFRNSGKKGDERRFGAGKYQAEKMGFRNDTRGNVPVRKFSGMRNGEGAVQTAERQEVPKQKAAYYCPVDKKCGGCQLLYLPYEKQLRLKQERVAKLLRPFCKVYPAAGMENPFHYRNKVHSVFARTKEGRMVSGIYQEGTHKVVPVNKCLIENEKADAIIHDIRGLLLSFKIKTYDEDTGYGLLRHVLIRTGHVTGEIMVVLVLASPILPSRNNFVKALRELHPEITTIVLNVNDKRTSMVLGEKETVIYGKGYIEDELCGCRFRISSRSFYQVNSVQTEALYQKAIELADLNGKERVIDAYCGIGTIGIIASKHAGEVISVELNPDAVRDARKNAKENGIENISIYQNDAGVFMTQMADFEESADVVFMDPPRAGSDEAFMSSVLKLAPKRVVYISCNPDTLARDLGYLTSHGYRAQGAWPYDMFPMTEEVETVVLLQRGK